MYAEVQKPHVYLQSSQVEVSNLYLGVPRKTAITLINGTLLPTQFRWGEVRVPALSPPGLQPSAPEAHVEADIGPRVPTLTLPTPPRGRCLAASSTACLWPTVPRKAELFEGATYLVCLFLAWFLGILVPCLRMSL